MRVGIKPGVRLASRDQAFTVVWSVMTELYRNEGTDPVSMILTSGIDGKHSEQSSHYRGEAWDFRGSCFIPEVRALVIQKAQALLGDDFWVGESEAEAIHVQWKPRGPVNG